MSFETMVSICNRTRRRSTSSGVGAVLGLVLLAASGCGHKAEPFPPPLRHPAATKDLTVQQRGDEIILSFGYPQTTVSGTPLEPLQRVEIWEMVRVVPEWTPPSADEEEPTADSEAPGDSDAEPVDDESTNVFEEVPGAGDDPSQPSSLADSSPPEDVIPIQADDESDGEAEPADAATADDKAEEDEAPEPPPVRPSNEKLLTIDASEFAATAQLRMTLEGAALSSTSFGNQIVVTLPIENPEETPEASGDDDADSAGEVELESEETGSAREIEYGSIFAIKTAVGDKLVSNFSNLAVIAHRTPPTSPSTFSLEPDQNKIDVRWQAGDEEIAGFNVYRRDAQSPIYGAPLAFVPLADLIPPAETQGEATDPDVTTVKEREYLDRTALLGQRYIYALTAVSNRVPVVESAITVEREVDYADRFAPSPPRNALALAETGRIRLLWDASPQDDVAGYSVARRDQEGAFIRLTEELITELEFSDLDVRSGRSYSYRIFAVDGSGNESEPSRTVDVRAP